MKLSQAFGFFLYLCGITTIFTSNFVAQDLQDERYLSDLYTAGKIIDNLRIELQDYQIKEEIRLDRDWVVEITVILIEMYEKIVAATATYFLMMHNPYLQQNLQDEVARIIARDLVKIFAILGKELTYFIFNHEMTLQEKLARCCAVIAAIVLIKVAIDQIPFKNKENSLPEKSIISDEKSGYLSKTFDGYR